MSIKKVLAQWLTICCLTLGRIKFDEREAMRRELSRSNQVIEWKIPEHQEDLICSEIYFPDVDYIK